MKKLKVAYALMKRRNEGSILSSVSRTVRRYSRDELMEAISTEEGRKQLVEKVYFQLPEPLKLQLNDNEQARKDFFDDISQQLASEKTKKLIKKKAKK